MWTGGTRAGVVLLCVLLALSASGSGCTQRAPEGLSPAPSTTSLSTPDATAAGVPNDHDLGAALPGPDQVGGIGGYTSCVTGEQVCYPQYSSESDPTLSWVKAVDGVGPVVLGGRWAQLEVRRPPERWMVRAALSDAKALCPVGEWVHQGDPRGFHPTPPMEGAGKLFPVQRSGFRGNRCAMESAPLGTKRHEFHRLAAVRDDVVVHVEASSRSLVLRLFEEYVDRLGWSASTS